MDIGTHCTYCGRLDFLPFDCHKCGKVVCGEHRINHDCVKETIAPLPEQHGLREQKEAAARETRRRESREQNYNTQAKQVKQVKQTPPGPDGGIKLGRQGGVKSERAVAAFERLKQLVGGSGRSNPAPKTPVAPRAAASPVAPAELKKTAVGEPNVKFADRMYYRVERPAQSYTDPLTKSQGTRPAKTMAMYFDKSLTVGQVLDKAGKQLGFDSHGTGLKRMNGSVLDLNAPISGVPQGATLVVSL